MDIFWKEMDGDSDWEGYDSSRDEISSVSSYNPIKEHVHRTFGSSLSLQSSTVRSSTKDIPYLEGERTSLSSNVALPQLSVAEVLYDSSADVLSPQKSAAIVSPSQQQKLIKPFSADDDTGVSSTPTSGAVEPVALGPRWMRQLHPTAKIGPSPGEGHSSGCLLAHSTNSAGLSRDGRLEIGGTLTFFHEEGARRCLEVSITLETSKTVSRQFIHPSRRNSPTITKGGNQSRGLWLMHE
uniref:Uncharacterized protein n=1 Tax=Fagus sylvatica TaxID=28930 RepID=A0A2N9FFE0_FAGSY